MTKRLLIPFQALHEFETNELVIDQPARCSQCNAEPAAFFETHRVSIKTGKIPYRTISKKYRSEKHVLVRLPLCETCYLKGYLASPDSYVNDTTALGEEARRSEKLSNVGGIIAGIGILLITPLIPAAGFLAALKSYWYVLLGGGVLLLIITWVLQRRSQAGVRKTLEQQGTDLSIFPQADVWPDAVAGELDPASIVLQVAMENESWMADCSRLNGWRLEE